METMFKVLVTFFVFYSLACGLNLFSLIFPERDKRGALITGIPNFHDVHLWWAPYPVKTSKGWRVFKYVKRVRVSNGGMSPETSDSCWHYL
jgi:hypothetical protein